MSCPDDCALGNIRKKVAKDISIELFADLITTQFLDGDSISKIAESHNLSSDDVEQVLRCRMSREGFHI